MAEQNPTLDYSNLPAGERGPLEKFIQQNPQLSIVIGAVIIILATLIAYLPATKAGYIWDDDYYVSNNSLLDSWDGLQRIWFEVFPSPEKYPLPQYYPMTFTSFWIEHRLWGDSPAGYHIVNITLHICNAMLVWLILRKLTVPGAWLAAAIFAVHPLNVESVAWVSERKNVLSLLFFLAALYVYLRYAGVIAGAPKVAASPKPKPESDDPDDDGPPTEFHMFTLPDDPQRLYGLAAALFIAALFAKTVAFALPAVILLILWWKKPKIGIKDILPLVPFLIVGVAMGALTSYMEKYRVGIFYRPAPWHYADSPLLDFGARCIIAGQAIWFYLLKLILPTGLSFNYPRWTIDPANPALYVFPAAAIAVMLAIIAIHKKIGGRATVVAVLGFVGLLFPALGFLNVWPMQFAFVANHFAYYATIAAIALFAAILTRKATIEIVAGVAAVLLIVLPILSFKQAQSFQDSKTLWTTTWKQSNKTSWLAANNYGTLIIDEAPGFAEVWFFEALKLKQDYVEPLRNLARIAATRAVAIQDLERRAKASTSPAATLPTTRSADDFYAEAIDYCRQAIKIDPMYIDGHFFLGRLLLTVGKTEEARQEFYECVKILPTYLDGHMSLGRIAMQQGNIDLAVQNFLDAANAHPDSSEAHAALGTALMQKGDARNGLEEWDNAIRLAPTNYRLGLDFGARLASDGKYAAAGKFFEMAAKANPRAADVYNAWGLAAAKAGFPKEAQTLFERAVLLDSKYVAAKENLEALQSGRLRPATTQSATAPSGA